MRYTREDGCRAWLTYALMRADALNAALENLPEAFDLALPPVTDERRRTE